MQQPRHGRVRRPGERPPGEVAALLRAGQRHVEQAQILGETFTLRQLNMLLALFGTQVQVQLMAMLVVELDDSLAIGFP